MELVTAMEASSRRCQEVATEDQVAQADQEEWAEEVRRSCSGTMRPRRS